MHKCSNYRTERMLKLENLIGRCGGSRQKIPPFLGCGVLLPPGVDGPPSVLEGVSVLGEESVLGERSETAESSEVSGSFPEDLSTFWTVRESGCSGRAGDRDRQREKRDG